MPSTDVIAEQRHRWLSMQHVGSARPVVRAFVRKGHLSRHYRTVGDDEVFGFVPGLGSPNDVWYGEWVPDSDYVEIPNVKDAKGDQDYSQNGIEQVTMTIDNIGMIEREGKLGALFHTIERGYYSPERGNPSSRGERTAPKNEWYNRWKDKDTQLVILGGYGEAVFPLHVGLIDKTQLTSKPDTISVTMRNMGQLLSDQHVFMDAKNLYIRDPITFADRVAVQEGPNVANTAQAKSEKPGSSAARAVDGESKTAWVSAEHDDPDELDWIEFPIPSGHFIKFELFAAFANLEMFVSLFTTNQNIDGGGPAQFGNGKEIGEGWLDTGKGHVPGTDIPFVNYVPGVREAMTTFPITEDGQKVISGDNTRLRVWFRHLHQTSSDSGREQTYRAGVQECRIRDASVPEAPKKEHWILIDDVADMVKVALQWAGFHEWEIEDTGVRLSDKVVFDRQKFLIDIINYVKERVGYIFYIKPPADFDIDDLTTASELNKEMGIAVFRQSSSMKQEPIDPIESVRDDNLITAAEAEFDANALPDSVRVRGKALSDKLAANDPAHIHAQGADRSKRYQASYRPVWARENSNGAAHLRRPEVHYDYLLDSTYDCEVACLLIAFRAALESAKGSIEIPLWPLIHLDHQTLLFDRGTGMSTRIWNVSRTWNWVGGAESEFKMDLGGSYIDVDNIAQTRVELEELLNAGGRMPAPIARGPWEEVHRF